LPGLRPLSSREVLGALDALGFRPIRQRGSHLVMQHPDGRTTVIPIHPGEEIGRGLLRKIIRDAGIEVDEFLAQT
jgi:predicted RNA binding protein YcfA (HicA-like mRNA interferase family)